MGVRTRWWVSELAGVRTRFYFGAPELGLAWANAVPAKRLTSSRCRPIWLTPGVGALVKKGFAADYVTTNATSSPDLGTVDGMRAIRAIRAANRVSHE